MSKDQSYEQGRHDERQRTMQLIGGVRMALGVMPSDIAGRAFDELVMNIVAEPLMDKRELQPVAAPSISEQAIQDAAKEIAPLLDPWRIGVGAEQVEDIIRKHLGSVTD